jgi:hypothetical protein
MSRAGGAEEKRPPSGSGRGSTATYLQEMAFIAFLGVRDDLVRGRRSCSRPAGAAAATDRRIVDLLEEGQRVRRLADGQRLGHVRNERLGLVVLVVRSFGSVRVGRLSALAYSSTCCVSFSR